MPTEVGTYEVRDDEAVSLTLHVGEGQPGHSTVMVDSRKRASRRHVTDLVLGAGASLRGRVLVTTTTVVDLRAHDRTSVTLELTNGNPLVRTQSMDADASGVMVYVFVITFA